MGIQHSKETMHYILEMIHDHEINSYDVESVHPENTHTHTHTHTLLHSLSLSVINSNTHKQTNTQKHTNTHTHAHTDTSEGLYWALFWAGAAWLRGHVEMFREGRFRVLISLAADIK